MRLDRRLSNPLLLVDPKIDQYECLDQSLPMLKRLSCSRVITLCSQVQLQYFKERGFQVIDIGEGFLTVEERDVIVKELGEAETRAYLNDVKNDYPYNPVIIAGGIHSVISYSIIQLLVFVKNIHLLHDSRNIIVLGRKEFVDTLKACATVNKVRLFIRHFNIHQRNQAFSLKKEIKELVFSCRLIFESIRNGPLYLIFNSKNVRHYLATEFNQKLFYPIRLVSFPLFGLCRIQLRKLKENTDRALAQVSAGTRSKLIHESLVVFHNVGIRPLFQRIICTVIFYGLLKRRRRKIVFISELNHGESNLFLTLYREFETIFVQHAIIPGSNRAGILTHVEYNKVALYTKFRSGKLAVSSYRASDFQLLPYIYRPPISSVPCVVVRRQFSIAFAPTTLSYFFSDFEIPSFLRLCSELNDFCLNHECSINVKFHQKTPYIDFIKSSVAQMRRVKIYEDLTLAEVLRESDILISSENSNTIIEGFLYQKPVIIYNPLRRMNYLIPYFPDLVEVHSVHDLMQLLEGLVKPSKKKEAIIQVQNQFITDFVC
jgi:hypothetical protein